MRVGALLVAGATGLVGCGSGVTPVEESAALGEARAFLQIDERSAAIVNAQATAPLPSPDSSDPSDKCLGTAAQSFARVYQNSNLVAANSALQALDTPVNMPDSYTFDSIVPCYWAMNLLVRTYMHPVTAPRLTPAARLALEHIMLHFINRRSRLGSTPGMPNDTSDVWSIHMSENHDAMQKAVYLLATQALRPVLGDDFKLNDQRSLLDHQNAWRSYWKLYFQTRAREGIGLEVASPAYSKYTLMSYLNVRDLVASTSVRDQAEKFITLYLADTAQDFQAPTGVRGGAETRTPKDLYSRTGDGDYYSVRPWLYIHGWHDNIPVGTTDPTALFPATSDYRIPAIVTDMARDQAKLPFPYVSRRPGRLAAMTGSGNSLVYQVGFDASGNSNLRRYSYNAGDYVLGTLKLDPTVQYTLLTNQNRWMGVMFAQSPATRIGVFGLGTGSGNPASGYNEILGDAGAGAMVVARDPHFSQSSGTRVYLSMDLWNNSAATRNDAGWFFTYAGNAYAGIRIANLGYIATAAGAEGKWLDLQDGWSPIVIQMGRAATDGSFTNFRNLVKSKQYGYVNGTLTYQSIAGDTYVIQRDSLALASVNGGGSLDPAKTYSSPYIFGYHGTNMVELSYANRPTLFLDFTF